MFLISAHYRPSRSKCEGEKAGVVYYRITGMPDKNGKRPDRTVNSDIHATDSSVLKTERIAILSQIRLLYCVIERREDSGKPFNIDNVVDDFRMALAGDEAMADIVRKSQTDFPIRRDIVSIGREFRGEFQYELSFKMKDKCDGLFDYIFNLVQSLKNEHRSSQAKSFTSLISSLRYFTEAEEIDFSEIDAGFVHDYSEWLKHKAIADSSQSFYLRTLRTVLNKAYQAGLLKESPCWFENVNTKIYKAAGGEEKRFDREILLNIEKLDLPANGPLALARDMFMFGFYCGGMELVDISYLTIENVRGNHLVYNRRKKGLEKTVVLGAQAKEIIKRYSRDGQYYLFPLLEGYGAISFEAVSRYVGRYLNEIGKMAGHSNLSFSMNISAFNSFTSGVSISELLLRYGNLA